MEVEVPGSPELISNELRDWVVNIGKELEQRQPRRGRNRNAGAIVPTIFRVPPHLLTVSRESYIPKIFSFGLFDLHERKISRLDDHRYELASVFKDIVGIRRWSRVCWKLVGNSVMTQVGLYDDFDVVTEKDSETVMNLLCLDAVFMVCFIEGRHQALCKTCREQYPILNDVIQREPLWSRRNLILFDIFLFQNQIPLELIHNVVDLMSVTEKSRLRRILSSKSDEVVDPLHKVVVDAVEMVYSNLPGFLVLTETIHKISFMECKHLLHCLYNVICYDPLKTSVETPVEAGKEKTDSIRASSTPGHLPESSPVPSETSDLRTESQGRKELGNQSSLGRRDFGNQSSLSRGFVVPSPAQEIIEDAQPQGSGNVPFKNQAERVHFLFRGEDMARLFSPENRFGDGKRKVAIEERESNPGSIEKTPIPQHPDNAADSSAAMHSPAPGQPGTPPLNAPQQVGNSSIATSSTSGSALGVEKESPASKIEGQATSTPPPRKNQAGDGFRVLTPDGHSSRREFFGSQGKEKMVAHRLPDPNLRGPPGSSLRPWLQSPRIFGDGSAWSLDSEPSSPQSQLSSRPASDRKSNPVAVQEIGQSNLQVTGQSNLQTVTFTANTFEKPTREESSSPGSGWGCNGCCCREPMEPEAEQNRPPLTECCSSLMCTRESSPLGRAWPQGTTGFNCKDSNNNARPKRRRSCCAFLLGCVLCAPSKVRSSEAGARVDHIPSLTQLRKVGIQVAVGKTRYISEVTFKTSKSKGFQGTLYLPAFDVLEETEGLLRNLLTYEHVVEKKNNLLSYIHLMDNLIDTEEDVEVLKQRGVIRANSLGSNNAVFEMWKTLNSGYVISLSPHYQDLYESISDHCSRISHARNLEFRNLYQARPWLVGLVTFVIFVILVTLISTVVATVYTVVTYYYPHKHN